MKNKFPHKIVSLGIYALVLFAHALDLYLPAVGISFAVIVRHYSPWSIADLHIVFLSRSFLWICHGPWPSLGCICYHLTDNRGIHTDFCIYTHPWASENCRKFNKKHLYLFGILILICYLFNCPPYSVNSSWYKSLKFKKK